MEQKTLLKNKKNQGNGGETMAKRDDSVKKKVPELRFKGFTDDWEQRKLGEIFNYEQPTKYIVKSTEYDDTFNTPVLTAGKSFLLGYTDEITGIKNATVDNPVVIFDDFTTGSHYVDFPFKIKSSAMKLLSLNDNSDNFYFMFNTLKNIKYVPQSHERHWISKFSEFEIYKPSQEEQEKIGSFFKQLDETIALHQRKLDLLKEQKKGFLQKMFPKNGEKVPELRFAGFADDWEEHKVGNFLSESKIKGSDGSVSKKLTVKLWRKGIVPKEEIYKGSSATQYYIRLAGQFMYGKLDFLNQAFGILPNELDGYESTLDSPAFDFKDGINPNFFLEYVCRENFYKYQGNIANGSRKAKRIHADTFFDMPITIPNFEEQQKIGSFFKQLDDTIALHQRKLDLLKEQKKGFLQKMFV